MSKRWPLHPPPYPDESLLSWIIRIASLYDMNPPELLAYEFGIDLDVLELYSIDINPPINLLNQLSERTGIEFNTIRALTAQGYVPLLIDTLENTETNLFGDYINQFNVFPGKRKNVTDQGNGWIPWFDNNRFATTQGCETCLSNDHEPYLRLHWRFPWMMSCPVHKLRTLIEELNSLVKIIDSKTRSLTVPFWQELNLFVRQGFGRYTLFEQCDCNKQLRLMLVAALVFKAIFSREVKFSSTVVDLLTPLPIYNKDLYSVYPGAIIKTSLSSRQEHESSTSSAFEQFSKHVDELITLMHSDPEAVKSLRSFIMTYDSTGARLSKVDECLRELGIKVDIV